MKNDTQGKNKIIMALDALLPILFGLWNACRIEAKGIISFSNPSAYPYLYPFSVITGFLALLFFLMGAIIRFKHYPSSRKRCVLSVALILLVGLPLTYMWHLLLMYVGGAF